MTWYEAYAFCIWDGGFLPTDAEWELAASGGEERVFPWSSPPGLDELDDDRASYDCLGDGGSGCSVGDLQPVGSRPDGAGRWGHDDLAGNVKEWTLDWWGQPAGTCDDCYTSTPSVSGRVFRGGDFTDQPADLRATNRFANGAAGRGPSFGFRCARPPGPLTGTVRGHAAIDILGRLGPYYGVSVWADLDADGEQDEDEPSTLIERPIVESLPLGAPFTLHDVPVGAWAIQIELADPLLVVSVPEAGFHEVQIEAGDVLDGVDFTVRLPEPGTVHGTATVVTPIGEALVPGGLRVFADLDGNGALDEEAGEPWTEVEAGPFGVGLGSGRFTLTGIPPGPADIRIENPAPEYLRVAQPEGGFLSHDFAEGDVLSGLEFLLEAVVPDEGRIAGTVRYQGVGFAGVIVYADVDGDGQLTVGEPSAVTFAPIPGRPEVAGTYALEGVPPGDVDVRVVNPDPVTFLVEDPDDGVVEVSVEDGDTTVGVDFALAPNLDGRASGCATAAGGRILPVWAAVLLLGGLVRRRRG